MMKKSRIMDMVLISMCASIIAISAWLAVPFFVSFTLQTFAIFLICLLFDIKKSFAAIALYLTLGICGLPVFSGFGAGFGVLLGPSGGYLLSFLLVPTIMCLFLHSGNRSFTLKLIASLISLLLCYICGTLWYYFNFASADISLWDTAALCVLPFIIPDLLKIFLAIACSIRLERIFKSIFGGYYE